MELMFDLETLDIKPMAVVLSLGAVTFERDGTIHDRFYRILKLQEQLDHGRTTSEETLLWWMRQDPTARAEAFNPVRCPVPRALCEFSDFVANYNDPEAGKQGITRFWANDPDFDGVILKSLADTYGVGVPWGYNQLRAQRTIVDESGLYVKGFNPAVPIAGLAYMPVYDCEFQVAVVTECRRILGTLRNNT